MIDMPAIGPISVLSPPADIVTRFLDQGDELAWLRDRVKNFEHQRRMDVAEVSAFRVHAARQDEVIADLEAALANQYRAVLESGQTIVGLRVELAEARTASTAVHGRLAAGMAMGGGGDHDDAGDV